jgi:hypothetical protein
LQFGNLKTNGFFKIKFTTPNDKIPLEWLNKSIISFKLDCKNCFLKFWLNLNVLDHQINNLMIDHYFFKVIWYYSEINTINHHHQKSKLAQSSISSYILSLSRFFWCLASIKYFFWLNWSHFLLCYLLFHIQRARISDIKGPSLR